jgi:hypothetical protein
MLFKLAELSNTNASSHSPVRNVHRLLKVMCEVYSK